MSGYAQGMARLFRVKPQDFTCSRYPAKYELALTKNRGYLEGLCVTFFDNRLHGSETTSNPYRNVVPQYNS